MIIVIKSPSPTKILNLSESIIWFQERSLGTHLLLLQLQQDPLHVVPTSTTLCLAHPQTHFYLVPWEQRFPYLIVHNNHPGTMFFCFFKSRSFPHRLWFSALGVGPWYSRYRRFEKHGETLRGFAGIMREHYGGDRYLQKMPWSIYTYGRAEILEGGSYERKVVVARNVSYLKTKGPPYMEPIDKRSNTSCCCFLNANLLKSSLTMVLLLEEVKLKHRDSSLSVLQPHEGETERSRGPSAILSSYT